MHHDVSANVIMKSVKSPLKFKVGLNIVTRLYKNVFYSYMIDLSRLPCIICLLSLTLYLNQ